MCVSMCVWGGGGGGGGGWSEERDKKGVKYVYTVVFKTPANTTYINHKNEYNKLQNGEGNY